MFHTEKMTEEMHDEILAMVEGFYHSDAVSHPVDRKKWEQTFSDAVSDDPILEGHVLKVDGKTAGFAYVTVYYACETGGRCLMLEELYLKEEYRGRGYGSRYIRELMETRPEIRRFRLEVSEDNEAAVRFYQRLGFDFLAYDQMAWDR